MHGFTAYIMLFIADNCRLHVDHGVVIRDNSLSGNHARHACLQRPDVHGLLSEMLILIDFFSSLLTTSKLKLHLFRTQCSFTGTWHELLLKMIKGCTVLAN